MLRRRRPNATGVRGLLLGDPPSSDSDMVSRGRFSLPAPQLKWLLVASCLGCREARRDSAPGVTSWTVDAQSIFDVGAEGTDTLETFGDVVGAARLGDGSVVIADARNYNLRYFD